MSSKDEIPGVHIRIYGENTKIRSRNLEFLKRAAKFCDLTFTEFCRMSSMKEAKRVMLIWRKDKVKIAKKILFEDKLRQEKEKIKKEFE